MVDATVTPIHDARYCGGKKHQGEGTCTQPAGWGTPHPGVGRCKLHGGCAPSSVKAGELALVERDARLLFEKVAPQVTPIENPLEAFAQVAGRVVAWMELMDALLDEVKAVGYQHEKAGEQVDARVQLYERALDRCAQVLAMYARLRIDERLAEITERQKLVVVRAIEAALDEVGIVDGQQRQDARRRVARQLRLVQAG
jgi:hypothetical protein